MSGPYRWLVTACLLLAGSSLVSAADSTLIEFELKDQFKFEHHDEDFHGKVLLVMVGNKKGGKFARVWSEHLQDSIPAWGLDDDVELLSVADMGGVPFFLKGMIRGKMPKEPNNWMLMDWGSKFHKAYDCEKDVCNIIYFDAESRYHDRFVVTEWSDGALRDIQAELAWLTGSESEGSISDDEIPPAPTELGTSGDSAAETTHGDERN